MYTELIVNVTEHETRVALLEDGKLAEIFIERGDEQNISGNIYKGRVQRVLPGMQAAFIDIGLNQASFLYIDDLVLRTSCDTSASICEKNQDTRNFLLAKEPAGKKEMPRIEHMLTEGQQIIVQIAKAPIGNKGARVTAHISLPGRFLVLMPMVNHLGISRRIEDEKERERLKNIITNLRDNTFGYIVRTAAEGIQKEQLEKEMRFLLETWNTIQGKSIHAPVPSLLHEDLNVTLRAIRDLLTQETDKLVIDSKALYRSVVNCLKQMMSDLKVEVECYNGVKNIFDFYHIENEIYRALQKKVWLKSGGYIIIEHTEALVAIDVNTGRYVGKKSFDETIFKTNLEAVWEIAHQIRLRNIGGIIIIDFIDMNHIHDREKIFNALKDAMQHDKCRTRILPMSEMGLIQMTRKRVKKSINRILCEPCFYCGGNGFLLSRQSICYKIYRKLVRDTRDMMGNGFVLRVHPDIADYLHKKEYPMLHALEQKINGNINIQSDFHLHLEEFQIFETIKPAS
jgi:ribonuclease G